MLYYPHMNSTRSSLIHTHYFNMGTHISHFRALAVSHKSLRARKVKVKMIRSCHTKELRTLTAAENLVSPGLVTGLSFPREMVWLKTEVFLWSILSIFFISRPLNTKIVNIYRKELILADFKTKFPL